MDVDVIWNRHLREWKPNTGNSIVRLNYRGDEVVYIRLHLGHIYLSHSHSLKKDGCHFMFHAIGTSIKHVF